MIYLKRYENNNKLNNLIDKYYKEHSQEIIEIINTYSVPSDAQNIMQKLSFIIESPGDIEIIKEDGNELAYFIDMKEVDAQTIFYDIGSSKFSMNSYKNYMDYKNK